MPLEFYVRIGDSKHIKELIVASDKLAPAELQKRMLSDDPAWKRGRFRKLQARPVVWALPDYSYRAA